MKLSKESILPFIYFFFNRVGLPHGLLYTALLSPLLLIWLIYKRQTKWLIIGGLVTLPFMFVHLSNGVELYYYFRSVALFASVLIFGLSFCLYLQNNPPLNNIFSKILSFNLAFTILALILFFTPYRSVLWVSVFLTPGFDSFPRLSLLTYEPSYYSTLMVPIFYYYFLQLTQKASWQNLTYFGLFILFPLALAFSLGVLILMLLGVFFYFLKNFSAFLKNPFFLQNLLLSICISGFLIILLIIFYPENALFVRLYNVVNGLDNSGRGRTYEAFQIAYELASLKSIWWGVGFGQVKIIGLEVISKWYAITAEMTDKISVYNAVAETFAVFGVMGLILRFGFIFYGFLWTKVWQNEYRLLLFVHIFFYQFTGSYVVNIAEYVIWILAFSRVFPEFDNIKSK